MFLGKGWCDGVDGVGRGLLSLGEFLRDGSHPLHEESKGLAVILRGELVLDLIEFINEVSLDGVECGKSWCGGSRCGDR